MNTPTLVQYHPSKRFVISRVIALLRLESTRVIRQKSTWIAVLPLVILVILIGVTDPMLSRTGSASRMADWACMATVIVGFGYSAAFTDHFVGDSDSPGGPGMVSVITSTPFPAAMHWVTRTVATAILTLPLLLLLLGVGVWTMVSGHGPDGLLAVIPSYLLIIAPGTFWALTASGFVGSFIPSIPARIVAMLMWFWATLCHPGFIPIPSPTGTPLSPNGGYAAAGLFGAPGVYSGASPWFGPPISIGWALVSVALILVTAVLFTTVSALRTRRI